MAGNDDKKPGGVRTDLALAGLLTAARLNRSEKRSSRQAGPVPRTPAAAKKKDGRSAGGHARSPEKSSVRTGIVWAVCVSVPIYVLIKLLSFLADACIL